MVRVEGGAEGEGLKMKGEIDVASHSSNIASRDNGMPPRAASAIGLPMEEGSIWASAIFTRAENSPSSMRPEPLNSQARSTCDFE